MVCFKHLTARRGELEILLQVTAPTTCLLPLLTSDHDMAMLRHCYELLWPWLYFLTLSSVQCMVSNAPHLSRLICGSTSIITPPQSVNNPGPGGQGAAEVILVTNWTQDREVSDMIEYKDHGENKTTSLFLIYGRSM